MKSSRPPRSAAIWSSSGPGGSTTNLVRLLRAAEEGKGLGIDYGEALGEALLLEHDAFGGDASDKAGSRGLAFLAKVPVLGRKRYVLLVETPFGFKHCRHLLADFVSVFMHVYTIIRSINSS